MKTNKTAEIMMAAARGDLKKLKTLLAKGVTPQNLANRSQNAVTQAAGGYFGGNSKSPKHRLEIITELVAAGCPVQSEALLGAIGELEILRYLIQHGADVNAVHKGQTLLGVAIERADRSMDKILVASGARSKEKARQEDERAVAVIRLLIEAGADVNQPGGKVLRFGFSFPQSPLFLAVMQDHPGVIRLLCEAGARVDARDPNGNTPLLRAIAAEHEDAAIALMEAGADVNLPGEDAWTPLAKANETGSKRLIALLEAKSAKVPKAFESKEALLDAAAKGDLAAVRKLAVPGAKLDARSSSDGRNCTALALAAEGGHLPVVEYLLQAGATVDAGDHVMRTPLYYAAKAGQAEVIEKLAAAGANPNAAWKEPYEGMVTPLVAAAEEGHAKAAAVLLKAGADLSHRARDGKTAFSAAAWHGHTEALGVLVKGVEKNPKSRRLLDYALWIAVVLGNNESVKILLEAGANPRAVSMYEGKLVSAIDFARRKSKKVKHAMLVAALKQQAACK